MSKHDRIRIRTTDGTVYTLVARKSGGSLVVENEDRTTVLREQTMNGTILRSISVRDELIEGIVSDRDGDVSTLAVPA